MNRNSITIKRKERRRDRRRGMRVEARLGGQDVLLTDLSAAGFGIALDATRRLPWELRAGQVLQLELAAEDGRMLSLPVRISRTEDANGVLGGTFVDLTDEAYDFIEGMLTGRPHRRR